MKKYKNRVESRQSDTAVILCVYKSDNLAYLKEAIESILNQTYKCDLFIYRDGVVPSDLEDELDKYSLSNQAFIVKNERNLGLAVGLNFLIELCVNQDYKYIARMDSDDISRVNRIEEQIRYLEKNPKVDVLGSACHEFGANFAVEKKVLPKKHSDLKRLSILRSPFIHPTVVFRSKVFQDGNRYPTNTVLTEDMALWFNLLEKGYIFSNLTTILLDYRLDEKTLSRRKGVNKAFHETKLRFSYMYKLEQVTIKNLLLVSTRFFFHLLPVKFIKLAYKYLR